MFNAEVDKISNFLDGVLKINREYLLRNNDLLNFKDYFNINYNQSADGEIFPDVDQIMDEIPGGEKKKKKMGAPKKGGMPNYEEMSKKPYKNDNNL